MKSQQNKTLSSELSSSVNAQPTKLTKEALTVQFISAAETLPLRMRILRPGQPPENSHYLEDSLESTFHLGIFLHQNNEAPPAVKTEPNEFQKIICNGTFMKDVCTHFPDEKTAYRLRGMATDPEFRGHGLGSQILMAAENILRERGCKLLWFNARETAFIFYEKNGYHYQGDMFDIALIGPHKVMWKKL